MFYNVIYYGSRVCVLPPNKVYLCVSVFVCVCVSEFVCVCVSKCVCVLCVSLDVVLTYARGKPQ